MVNMLELIREYYHLGSELEALIQRNELMLQAKRAEFKLALLSNEPRKIEEARQDCVDVFSAGLDAYIEIWNKMKALETQHGTSSS